MRKAFFLLLVALVTVLAILWWKRPDLLEEIWLWLVGLAGTIAGSFQQVVGWARNKLGLSDTSTTSESSKPMSDVEQALARLRNEPTKTASTNKAGTASSDSAGSEGVAATAVVSVDQSAALKKKIQELTSQLKSEQQARLREQMVHPVANFDGTTITVVRYWSDSETTLGLLFINYDYFGYTLEDAHHDQKIPGKTRIPAGTYVVDFNRADTDLTEKYRKARFIKDIFTYHLEIKNVPNYGGVYIHNGGTSKDTEGCLLVSDRVNAGDNKTALTNSRNTFRNFYQLIGGQINNGTKVRILIRDESWFRDNFRQPKAA